MLCVWSVSGQKLAAAPVGDTFEDVLELKRHLRSQHGFPVCLQQLLQAGRCLEDGAALVEPVDLELVLLSTLSPKQMPQAERELFECAAEAGHVEAVRALLAAGVDKDLENFETGETALMRASSKGHVEMARLLLEAGADMNLQFLFGECALLSASFKGHAEIVRLLLEAQADMNLSDDSGETALKLASSEGHVAIVRLLLEAGADMNLQDRSGETALMRMRDASEFHVEIARLLLELEVEMNMSDEHGKKQPSPLCPTSPKSAINPKP